MLYGKLLLLNKIKGPVILAASDPSVGFKTGIIIWRFFIKYVCVHTLLGASQVALMVKNLPVSAGHISDVSSSLGLGRSPGGGLGNPLQYSCLENPMAEEPGGLQSVGSKRVGQDSAHMHVVGVY